MVEQALEALGKTGLDNVSVSWYKGGVVNKH